MVPRKRLANAPARIASAALIALAGAASACGDRPTEARPSDTTDTRTPPPPPPPPPPTAVAALTPYTPPRDPETGVYLLAKACDVLIGEAVVAAPDPRPTRYAHQLLVSVPEGATIRLVADPLPGEAVIGAAGGVPRDEMIGRAFACDARNPNDPSGASIVVDPATGHPGKGDGPVINTAGVTLDLNGLGLTSRFPASAVDPLMENVGVAIAGPNVTVTSSSAVAADGRQGVSTISAFGANVEIAADGATLRGARTDHDADASTPAVYNLETAGGIVGVGASGLLVQTVKSVNLDALEGIGLELRRCAGGSTSVVADSHLEGGAGGVFVRECGGVTLERNFVSGHGADGIATREVVSTAANPVIIRDNVIEGSLSAIAWGRDSRNAGGLVISGNRLSGYTACGIRQSTRNASVSPLSLAELAAANVYTAGATDATCVRADP